MVDIIIEYIMYELSSIDIKGFPRSPHSEFRYIIFIERIFRFMSLYCTLQTGLQFFFVILETDVLSFVVHPNTPKSRLK